MPPAYRSPNQPEVKSNAGKLSYVFAFGAAVFIVSGNLGVAAVFGLMAVASIALAIRHLPPGGRDRPVRAPEPAPEQSRRAGGPPTDV